MIVSGKVNGQWSEVVGHKEQLNNNNLDIGSLSITTGALQLLNVPIILHHFFTFSSNLANICFHVGVDQSDMKCPNIPLTSPHLCKHTWKQ